MSRATMPNATPRYAPTVAAHRRQSSSTLRSRASSSSSSSSSSAAASAPTTPEDIAAWRAATDVVKDILGDDDDERADTVVAKAFGWRAQGYWRNQKVCEVPNMERIEASLAYLASVGVTRENIGAIVSKQPEIFACDVEQLEAATTHIEKNFFMKRNTSGFVKFVVRVPMALGCNVDCAGEGRACEGECNRCWART
jgi:hypothetical protein